MKSEKNPHMKNSVIVLSLILSAFSTVKAADTDVADTLSHRVQLQDAVITGSNSSTERNLLPYTVSVVGPEQLEAAGSTRVLEILSTEVPSLFVTQRGILGFGVSNGGAGHIKLRGIGGDRASAVLMMVDGQPQFAGIYSHHVADFYTKDYVERVEVLRGPGSVLYGSNAMAGVINVITRQSDRQGSHTQLSSEYGSYNTWQTTLSNQTRVGRFSSLASVSYDRTDGNIDGMTFRQWGGYVKLGYDFDDHWKGSADYTLTNFKAKDPVYATLDDPESTDIYRQSITRGEFSLALTNDYGSTGGTARVYYSYGNHVIDDPRHFRSTDDRFGLLMYQNFVPWTGAQATAGFDLDTYSGAIRVSGGTAHKEGSKTTIARKRIVEYSPYLTLSQQLFSNVLTLNGGVRFNGNDMFGNRWVPQAGFAVNPGRDWTLKGSVAMGYRNPSFRELYLYKMANPDLKPERLMNYELSASKRFSRYLTADLTVYYARGSDMIQVLEQKNVNTGRFRNKGVELSLHSMPLNNLRLTGSYSYLHSSLKNLTGAPRHQYFLGADWRVIRPLTVAAELRGTGRLFVSDLLPTQSYALLNAKVSYEVCKLLTLTCRVDNITNARYQINRGYEMPGTTVMGGFKLKF